MSAARDDTPPACRGRPEFCPRPARTVLGRYAPWEWCDGGSAEGCVLSGGLVVTGHPVAAEPPARLPARAAEPRWVMAYRIEDLVTGEYCCTRRA
ncbi:hypothetical protein ACIQAC_22745 [Streptomyces sp. NPDC088387]|uniref:hypothetical protein n=1 Tax=Streptomyces sp. NPDC088387 TaxID=3365859 RepID=UPI00380483BE